MKSPFIYGETVTGQTFVNRQAEKERLKQNFSSSLNTILMSPRRWGKSSLIEKVATELAQSDKTVRFCMIDLFDIRSEEEFYNVLATKILQASSTKLEEWVQHAKKWLKTITPKISIGTEPTSQFEVSFEASDVKRGYKDILELPEKISKSKNIKIIVCIDEFQNLAYFDEPLAFQKKLRATWQHHREAAYCLYGSKRHMLLELFQNKSMPFYKFGDLIHLDKISTRHWVTFITKSFKKTGKTIAPNLAEQIAHTVDCHSYYVQQLSHLVWINATKEATNKTLDKAVQDLLRQNNIFFEKEIELLSNTQLNFLKALSDKVVQFSAFETLKKYKLGSSSNVVKIKQALEDKEVINTFSEKIEFLDPMFALWFKQRLNN